MKKYLIILVMCSITLAMNAQDVDALELNGSRSVSVADVDASKKRTSVEILYGYLKIFPNELGVFEAEPSSVIAQINKQARGINNNTAHLYWCAVLF